MDVRLTRKAKQQCARSKRDSSLREATLLQEQKWKKNRFTSLAMTMADAERWSGGSRQILRKQFARDSRTQAYERTLQQER
jgi:hypothetical protein